MIERIVRVPLRTVWKHEAHDFTVWLQQNIDVLTDIIGFEISNPEREHSTGNFNVDIKAEDSSGNTVIIENQLGKSDHDHLGKIITYMAAFEKTVAAIWIVYEPRQEHIDAISWLNTNSNDCGFFLLKLEAIQIGKSAPLITKIVGPSEEAKQVGRIKQEDSMRHQLRLSFWTRLLEISKQQKHTLFNSISPTKDTWIGTSAGKRGFQYSYWITKESIRAELRIDLGKDSDNENLRLFHALKKYQPEIETSFGRPLEWNEADGYRVCIVREVLTIGGYRNPEDDWDRIIHQAINAMKRLEEATKQYVMKLN